MPGPMEALRLEASPAMALQLGEEAQKRMVEEWKTRRCSVTSK